MFNLSSHHAARALRSPRRWAPALALALFNAAAVGLNAQAEATLSLDQALRLAQDSSRQLPAQDSAIAAARALAAAAGERPDPTLKTGLNSLPVNGPDRFSLTRDSFTMLSVGVTQELTGKDKLRARSARFEREAEAAQAGRAVALANLRRDTAMAWLERHYLERMRKLLQVQRAESALPVDAADAAYRAGRGSQSDVFAARSAVALVDDRIQQVEARLAISRTRLSRWVGPDAALELAVPPGLDSARLASGDLEAHLQHHPQIALMASQEAVARAEADIAQSNKRSDWNLELTYSQRGPAYSNMVSLGLSVPLQWDAANRQDRELAARLALADQMRAQREEVTREHLAEARGWVQQWLGNRDRLARYDSSLIPLANERTRATIAAYRGGAAMLPAVLEARRMELDTRIERLRLEMETAGLWAQLEYLIPAEPATALTHRATATKEQHP